MPGVPGLTAHYQEFVAKYYSYGFLASVTSTAPRLKRNRYDPKGKEWCEGINCFKQAGRLRSFNLMSRLEEVTEDSTNLGARLALAEATRTVVNSRLETR